MKKKNVLKLDKTFRKLGISEATVKIDVEDEQKFYYKTLSDTEFTFNEQGVIPTTYSNETE